jgi:hypothetical protein
MGKTEEGTKLLHILRPAIVLIPEIEAPLGAVKYCLFRSPSTPSRSGQVSLCLSIYYAVKSHSTA